MEKYLVNSLSPDELDSREQEHVAIVCRNFACNDCGYAWPQPDGWPTDCRWCHSVNIALCGYVIELSFRKQ
jgi:predicted Zn-ribbon and HTH transcriptional regulator